VLSVRLFQVVETMYSNQELADIHCLVDGNAVVAHCLYQKGIQDDDVQIGKHV
jgi:hypothetical protein